VLSGVGDQELGALFHLVAGRPAPAVYPASLVRCFGHGCFSGRASRPG